MTIDKGRFTARRARLARHDTLLVKVYASAIIACTHSTRTGSRKTLRGLMRCRTSRICWWTAGSAAVIRLRARRNLSMQSKVSGKAKSGTPADAHGVSISPHAASKKAGASPVSGSFFLISSSRRSSSASWAATHALTVHRVEERIAEPKVRNPFPSSEESTNFRFLASIIHLSGMPRSSINCSEPTAMLSVTKPKCQTDRAAACGTGG